jgi:hypothetical protein
VPAPGVVALGVMSMAMRKSPQVAIFKSPLVAR